MNYLNSLNSEQKRAVQEIEGPVLIVAGAGAGKTKTLTHRILHLIMRGVEPQNILAITFTNKAAKEMKERVSHLLKDNLISQRSTPFVSTFHAFGVQVIKENAEILNIPRHFNIIDTDDSKKILKDILKSFGLEPKDHLDKIRHIISNEKGRGVTVKEYLERAPFDFSSELTKKVWPRYEERLKSESSLDFDDLLLKTLKIFENFPNILSRYQDRFRYIHIDEYQDTNRVQNSIVELLAKKYRNICVVGDTDQNIYSWRGAEIKNMLHFEKTYPEVKTIFLEENYRSTKNILSAANSIIEKNNYRIPKKLFTQNSEGEKISVYEARSEGDEALFIASRCRELIEEGSIPDEIAVLYRANFQSRILEESFLSLGIPYQMLGVKFFERKETKDVLALIRASLNKDALSDFVRVVNLPPRGIGKTTIDKIIQGKEDDLPASTKIKIDNFRKILSGFGEILKKEKISESIKYIIKTTGIDEMYNTGHEEDTERLENIMELVSFAVEYDIYPGEEGVEKFLTDVSLSTDQDNAKDGGGVRLMTVHASKGLEFENVFVTGLEEDLFPHKKLSEKRSGEDGEEERRLFYVAITRAKKKLFLTWARMRTIFGSLEVNTPSEFLLDIPEEYTNKESDYGENVSKPLISIDF
jgi:DNA helicase-2/ATP-dependent DNA helicase PcrA